MKTFKEYLEEARSTPDQGSKHWPERQTSNFNKSFKSSSLDISDKRRAETLEKLKQKYGKEYNKKVSKSVRDTLGAKDAAKKVYMKPSEKNKSVPKPPKVKDPNKGMGHPLGKKAGSNAKDAMNIQRKRLGLKPI